MLAENAGGEVDGLKLWERGSGSRQREAAAEVAAEPKRTEAITCRLTQHR